jgi:hypothetical protein
MSIVVPATVGNTRLDVGLCACSASVFSLKGGKSRHRAGGPAYTIGMTSSQPIALTPRGVFSLIGLTLKLIFGRFGTVFGIALLVLLPLTALEVGGQLVNLARTFFPTEFSLMAGALCLSLVALVFGVLYSWMEGALTHNAIERVLGRTPGIRTSYGAARPAWPALFGSNLIRQVVLFFFSAFISSIVGFTAAFLSNASAFGVTLDATVGTVVAIALTALCAPVAVVLVVLLMLLAVNWSLRAPAIVGEGIGGIEALSRSSALIKQNRWRMIGRLIPVALLHLLVVEAPLAFATSVITQNVFFGASAGQSALAQIAGALLVAGGVLSLIVTPFTIVYLALNYLDLRVRKENLANDVAAELNAPSGTEVITTQRQTGTHVDELAPGVFAAPLTPAQRIGAINRRLRSEPETAALQEELGDAFAELGNMSSALEAFERVRALAPGNTDVLLKIARVHRARRDAEAARTVLADYMRIETDPAKIGLLAVDPQLKSLLPAAN